MALMHAAFVLQENMSAQWVEEGLLPPPEYPLSRRPLLLALLGGAGTGKSALLSHIIPALLKKHSKEEVFVTATTGLAACAIGGTTVHQFAGMRPNDSDTTEMVRVYSTHVYIYALTSSSH